MLCTKYKYENWPFIILCCGLLLSITLLASCFDKTNNTISSQEVTNREPPKIIFPYEKFTNDAAFKSYVSTIIGNYEIIKYSDEYIILKCTNIDLLGESIRYYYYSSNNFTLINIENKVFEGTVSTTSDKLHFESLFDNKIREKYNLDSHMVKFEIEKGADYFDIFSHIQFIKEPISITKLIIGLPNKRKLEEEILDKESEDFNKQIK